MIVKVTQEDVNVGRVCDPRECPVARALSRLFPDALVRVGSIMAEIYNSRTGDMRQIWFPPLVEQFIHLFDGRAKVQPFEFEVTL